MEWSVGDNPANGREITLNLVKVGLQSRRVRGLRSGFHRCHAWLETPERDNQERRRQQDDDQQGRH